MAIATGLALQDHLGLDAGAGKVGMPARGQGRLVSRLLGIPAAPDPEESPGAFGCRVYVIASHFFFLRP